MLCAEDKREEAIDLALDYFDDLLLNGKLTECDVAFSSLDDAAIGQLASSILVSILGVTLQANALLPARSSFYDRVCAEVTRRQGRRYAIDLLEKYR